MRQNPYTVENLAAAMNEVYGTTIDKVATTHFYVKFEPQSEADMIALEELDLEFFDFPLEREVIELGDYYFQPSSKDDYPTFWAVVVPNFVFPAVQYEIIAELNLIESDPFLMRKAFERTGNQSEINERFPIDNFGGIYSLEGDCHPGCASWPCCLSESPTIDCDDDNIPDWCRDFDPNCYPGLPGYPACLGDDDDGGGVLNDCGCTISANPRFPGGCVQVEDTELGFEGVRNVRIIGWNGWFKIDTTYTNDNGCWKIKRPYRGRAWFWVKFRNDNNTKVCSAARGARLWQHIWALTDPIGRINGPDFNNVTINYNMWTEQGSQAHRYWGGASINNAYYEFQDFAAGAGINPAPQVTLYAATERRGQGFALMTHYIGPSGLGTIIGSELFETNGLSRLLSMIDLFADFGVEATQEIEAMFAGAGGSITTLIALFIPDVMIGANWNNSDELRELAFHELGHASLYPSMGNLYWEQLALAELVADALDGHPWGVSTSEGAGRIAVVESWAEHLGHIIAHGKYGVNNSIPFDTYLRRLEETRNFRANHVPIGIYLDLFDTGTEPISNDVFTGGAGTVMDNVSGFTTGQIFGLFDFSITSPTILQSRINTSLTPGSGNTVSAVNDLFSSY